jgi:hypothetical protein
VRARAKNTSAVKHRGEEGGTSVLLAERDNDTGGGSSRSRAVADAPAVHDRDAHGNRPMLRREFSRRHMSPQPEKTTPTPQLRSARARGDAAVHRRGSTSLFGLSLAEQGDPGLDSPGATTGSVSASATDAADVRGDAGARTKKKGKIAAASVRDSRDNLLIRRCRFRAEKLRY